MRGEQRKMKHAFLIMAHNNYAQLTLLIQSLDHPSADIFLHIDAKAEAYVFDKVLKYSKLFFIPRMRTNWGGLFFG